MSLDDGPAECDKPALKYANGAGELKSRRAAGDNDRVHSEVVSWILPMLRHATTALTFAAVLYGMTTPVPADHPNGQPEGFRFEHHVIDMDLPPGNYAQTGLADLDGDGRADFVMGRRDGELYAYQFQSAARWRRFRVGEDSPSDVGLCITDVDRDNRPDLVAGGAWYRNSGDLAAPFDRFVFDADLRAVHDMTAADIDGDGQPDVLTMSDRNNLRWYGIPDDPTGPWTRHDIGPAVHAGLSVGDLNGDGRLDVVRTDVWFENTSDDGTTWARHEIGPCTPPPPDFRPAFAFNATRSRVCDMNGDGRNDVVFTDGEIPGGKVWWMENVDGDGRAWQRHDVFAGDGPRRGAFHSLHVADFDGDADLDIFSCEMEHVRGERDPRWSIWENRDGRGGAWREHVILDANLGGHEAVVGDVTGDGRLDILAKPWRPHAKNALGGRMFVVFLENVSE